MRYSIYKSNGILLTQTADIEYSGEWMGARKVTLSIKSAIPESLTVGCYVVYRGARYELNVDPTVQKSAKVRTTGEGFLYENIQFDSITNDLVNCGFLDYVEYDNQLSSVSNPKFSFHADDVTDLVERIQANLDRLYTGTSKWTIEVDESYSPEKKYTNLPVSVDNINCWEALKLAYDTFDCKFVVDKSERKITIATSGDTLSVFKLGKNEGLTKIIKSSEANQQIISRLRAYGNSKNMPLHYYYYKCMQVFMKPNKAEKKFFRDYNYNFLVVDNYGKWTMFTPENHVHDDNTSYKELSYKVYNGNTLVYTGTKNYCFSVINPEDDSTSLWIRVSDDVTASSTVKIVFDDSCVNKNIAPTANKQFLIDNPARLLSAQNVMLPGFPATTYDPYLSMRESELGIREATKFFDGSDDEVDDIYPTIEDITFKNLRDAGYSIPTKYADNSYINTLRSNSDTIADDGVFGEGVAVTPEDFKIYLKDIGFNVIHDETIKISGTQPKISFTSGDLKGRDFEVDECEYDNTNKGYILTCKRVMDDSLKCYFPNKNYNAKAEDTFVLSEIYLPDMYVEAASARLETAATAYLAENNSTSFKYEVEIDPVYMARHTSDFHDKIKEGDLFWLDDDNLGIDNLLIEIANLTISEKEGKIPTYKVTLDDEKEAGTLQKIQNAIKGISNGTTVVNGGGGGGLSRSQIIQLADNQITNRLEEFEEHTDEKYLRKDQDDETAYNLKAKNLTATGAIAGASAQISGKLSTGDDATFGHDAYVDNSLEVKNATQTKTLDVTQGAKAEELKSHNYKSGDIEGLGFLLGKYGQTNDSYLEIDRLLVRKIAYFVELCIKKLSYVGGKLIVSPASMTISNVEEYDGYWRCYAKTNDGTKAVNLEWVVGDLARLQEFNINESQYTGAHNSYYWGQVVNVNQPNGYIDISRTLCDSGATKPSVGDDLVLCGNISDKSRQNVILISSYDNDAPSIKFYQGVGNGARYTFDGCDTDTEAYDSSVQGMFKKIYGAFYVGDRPSVGNDVGDNYLRYVNGKLDIALNSLKIVVSNTEKDIVDYVDENSDQFHIFETETSAVPTLTNEPYISWTDAERTKYSLYPNNAVVLNSDGRTWKFCKDETTGYYFEEFTDPWLLAQHQKVSDILDDACITTEERAVLRTIWQESDARINQAISDYGAFTSPSSRLSTAYAALQSTVCHDYMDDFLSIVANATKLPIYFSDYGGTKEIGCTTLSMTRNRALQLSQSYATIITEWDTALALERQSKIGETAAQEAKDYVDDYIQNNISTIVGNGLDNHIKNDVIPTWYNTNFEETPAVTKKRIEDTEDGLETVVENYTDLSTSVNGLIATTEELFVGSTNINRYHDFVEKENGVKVYLYHKRKHAKDDNENPLYWKVKVSGDGKTYRYKTTEVTSTPIYVADYDTDIVRDDSSAYLANKDSYLPRMVVSNTNTSGLATKDGFAAMFAQSVDAEGNYAAIAEMGVYVTHKYLSAIPTGSVELVQGRKWFNSSINKYIYLSTKQEDTSKGAYYYVESTAGISADKVSIISGNRNSSLGNYWSIDENGNAILKDIYARDITVRGVLLNLTTEITAGSPLLIRHGEFGTFDDLDVLRCGGVVRIKSLNSYASDTRPIRLPYYITQTYNNRTYTKYGTGQVHLMTPDELRLLINKRITIIVEDGCGLASQHAIGNIYNFENAYGNSDNNVNDKVDAAMCATPYYKAPTNDIETIAFGIYAPGTYNLEFKACHFKNGGTIYDGYVWVVSTRNLTSFSDIDSKWIDE